MMVFLFFGVLPRIGVQNGGNVTMLFSSEKTRWIGLLDDSERDKFWNEEINYSLVFTAYRSLFTKEWVITNQSLVIITSTRDGVFTPVVIGDDSKAAVSVRNIKYPSDTQLYNSIYIKAVAIGLEALGVIVLHRSRFFDVFWFALASAVLFIAYNSVCIFEIVNHSVINKWPVLVLLSLSEISIFITLSLVSSGWSIINETYSTIPVLVLSALLCSTHFLEAFVNRSFKYLYCLLIYVIARQIYSQFREREYYLAAYSMVVKSYGYKNQGTPVGQYCYAYNKLFTYGLFSFVLVQIAFVFHSFLCLSYWVEFLLIDSFLCLLLWSVLFPLSKIKLSKEQWEGTLLRRDISDSKALLTIPTDLVSWDDTMPFPNPPVFVHGDL